MKLPLHEYILTLAQVVGFACLVARLVLSGLVRPYPYFFSYLLVELLELCVPLTIPYGNVYGWVYLAFECVKLGLYVLVVFELYAVLLRDLKGIERLARRYSVVALSIATLLSILVVTTLNLPRHPLRKLFYFEIPIISSLVLFILLIAVFLVYYPAPLHKNALVYAIAYIVYFTSKTVLLFVNLRTQASVRVFSTILLYVGLCCVIFWTIFLSRAGERRTLAVGSKWSPPDKQQQVLLRLRQLNDSLLRARPK